MPMLSPLRWLSLLLALLPLWFGNWAIDFLEHRQVAWQEQRQEDRARRELEGMRARVEFPRRLEWCAGKLESLIGEATERGIIGESLATQLERLQMQLLGTPDLPTAGFLVRFGPGGSDDQLTHWGQLSEAVPRRVVQRILRSLHALSTQPSPVADSSVDRLLEELFGRGTRSEIIALSQQGIATPVLFQRKQYWLLWSPVRTQSEIVGGLLLLVPNDDTTSSLGYALTMRQKRNARRRCGFVRVMPSRAGDQLSRSLQQSGAFHAWLTRWRQTATPESIEVHGWPWAVPIGDARLFSAPIMPNGTHLAMLLLPRPSLSTEKGRGRFLLNWMLFLAVVLLWYHEPTWRKAWRIPLGWRFLGLFLFATLMPVFQLMIAVSAYLQENELTLQSRLRSHLAQTLQKFDDAKDRLRSAYCAAFTRVLNDTELKLHLQHHGLNDSHLLNLVTRHFRQGPVSLPLLAVSVFDIHASGPVSLGRRLPEGFTRQVRFYRYSLAQSHRESLGSAATDLPPLQIPEEVQAAMDCYEGSSGSRFTGEMEIQRSIPMNQSIGRNSSMMMHDRLAIGGSDRYTLLILWNDTEMDREILAQTCSEIRIEAPNLLLGLYRNAGDHLTSILPEDQHHPA
ncbi:MAG TPA: hypothetical protein PKO06_06085, partial [Candidatus Ozemobacteraceae bacterium]|nr:hypothetical protein [Candidatus Ozemobacteraceae bacterium]